MGFSITLEARCPKGDHDMYDMYPDWGPAKHDPQHPLNRTYKDALQSAMNGSAETALRDEDALRPDDN
jgi:hypothetical protein